MYFTRRHASFMQQHYSFSSNCMLSASFKSSGLLITYNLLLSRDRMLTSLPNPFKCSFSHGIAHLSVLHFHASSVRLIRQHLIFFSCVLYVSAYSVFLHTKCILFVKLKWNISWARNRSRNTYNWNKLVATSGHIWKEVHGVGGIGLGQKSNGKCWGMPSAIFLVIHLSLPKNKLKFTWNVVGRNFFIDPVARRCIQPKNIGPSCFQLFNHTAKPLY